LKYNYLYVILNVRKGLKQVTEYWMTLHPITLWHQRRDRNVGKGLVETLTGWQATIKQGIFKYKKREPRPLKGS